MTDRQAFARRLHGWGAAVTAIKPGTKRPAHKWRHWQSQPQTEAELERLPWRSAAAIGVVNGSGGFRIFDIDAVKESDGRPIAPVPEAVVIALLLALGLPDDYQWSYQSGSGAGFGVVVRCDEDLPGGWTSTKGVFIGAPKAGAAFDHLELRWSTGQTVIDGAHPAGPGYRWRRGERPFVPPARRSAAQVLAGFTAIANHEHSGPVAASGASSAPVGGHKASIKVERYGAAALADAIRQASTATPGQRNNTLFRETAALAELVNGGALDRLEVERALAGAALAAGLPAGETTATIASAFSAAGKTRRPFSPAANGNGTAGGRTAPPAAGDGDTAEANTEFKLDDTGNAERFVSQHGHAVRFNHSTGHWLVWAGTHWQRDDDGAAQRLAKETARRIYDEAAAAARAGRDEQASLLAKWARASGQEARRNALLNLAKPEVPVAVTQERLDRGDYLLNVGNGTLDLMTGCLRPHAPDDLLTYVLPAEYDPAATCPMWAGFIERVTGGDTGLIDYLGRAIGYTLSGSTAEQCLFFLYGRGANGKSTFIETTLTLLGDLATKVRAPVLMQSERDRVPNEIAALAGKRLVVSSELGDGGRLNEGIVKDLTGGDTMSARFLYGEAFQFKPTFKLWLYGNHKPAISGVDEGIWRRVQLIPFDVQIPKAERDPYLPAKLREELSGILAWAVRGWDDYRQGGLRPPARVAQATSDYRAESDILGKFIDDRCYEQEGAKAEAGQLYSTYAAWAAENGLRAHSNVWFAKALTERGYTKTRNATTKRQEYHGLGVAS